MNLSQLFASIKTGVAPPAKVSMPNPNVANQIRDHLLSIIPEAFKVEGVWVTGSNVWKFLYNMVPDVTSDIDVIVEPITIVVDSLVTTPRTGLIELMGATFISNTRPSVPADINGGGVKYESKGRTIDIWETSDDVIGSLMRYPEHSHAQARAAYSPFRNALIVLPNTKAA